MGGGPGIVSVVARCLVGAIVWGLLLSVVYHAPLLRGALIGLLGWGPPIILSARWRPSTDDKPIDAFGP
jgi:hypothetical protein